MKLTVLLCLTVVSLSFHVTLAKKKGGILDKFFNKNKNPKPKDDFKTKPNLYNQGGAVHKQDIPGSHHNPRPQQPAPGQRGMGEHGGYGGYPAQGSHPGHGGYPAQGSYPGYGGYPAQGGYPGHGGYPAQGGYPGHGGYINQNPNNHILSPHYGGSYGSYAPGRGSPYSRTVEAMGYVPSEKSKGFGRSAVMAAAGGAVAGMALGYGLGRIPRPHFHFQSPEEEYYYNYYMYRRYGLKSPDGSDFSRDYKAPPETYERFMSTCMKRKDLLPTPIKSKLTTKTPPTITTTSTTTTSTVSPSVSSNMTRNTTSNSTSAVPTAQPSEVNTGASPEASPGASPEASPGASPGASPEASAGAPAAMAVSYADAQEEDDDTVSVVEIGYPALIEQLKVRRCLELYIVYSEKYLRKSTTPRPRGGGQRTESSHLLLVLFIIVVTVT